MTGREFKIMLEEEKMEWRLELEENETEVGTEVGILAQFQSQTKSMELDVEIKQDMSTLTSGLVRDGKTLILRPVRSWRKW